MPPLRRQRRDRRDRAGKVRKRRNLTKFVPSGDSDFAMTARNFADYVHEHHEELDIDPVQSEYLVRLVTSYREALTLVQRRTTRTPSAIDCKNETRKAAEARVRMIGAKIRTDPTVDHSHKKTLRLRGLSRTSRAAKCPQRPPVLMFQGSGDGTTGTAGLGNGSGVHVLRFFDRQNEIRKQDVGVLRKSRPDGAARIELFIGFVPQGARIPQSVEEYVRAGHGWPLYVQSYTRSPIEVEFPMPLQPMLIVYWARWADSLGGFGRCCTTCVGRVEGWNALDVAADGGAERYGDVKVMQGSGLALPGGRIAGHLPAAQYIEAQQMQMRSLIVSMPIALLDDDDDDEKNRPEFAPGEVRLLEAGARELTSGPPR